MKRVLIVLVGLPGAGKTTIAQSVRAAEVIEADEEAIERALQTRRTIVVDDDNLTREDRLRVLLRFPRREFYRVALFVDTLVEICAERKGLPVNEMMKITETLVEPVEEEGFDFVFVRRGCKFHEIV